MPARPAGDHQGRPCERQACPVQGLRYHTRLMKVPSGIKGALSRPVLLVVLIMVVAGGLRFYHLGTQPLWLDEVLTWLYIGAGYAGNTEQDVHPPFYYSVVRVWMHGAPGLGIPAIAGEDNEFFLRAPSALLGVLTVPLVYALGRRLGGVQLGLVGALLFAIAPFQVRYGQEGRMYALFVFLAAVSLSGMASLLARYGPDASGAPLHGAHATPVSSRREIVAAWLAVVLGTVGALYTHNTAIVLLLSSSLLVFICLVSGLLPRGKFLRNWLLANAVIVICWAPWLPRMVAQAREVLADYWIPRPDLSRVIETLGTLYLPLTGPVVLYVGVYVFLTALWGMGLLGWRRKPGWAVFLLVSQAAPIVGLLLVSLVRPLFLARTLIWTTIPFYLMLGAGILSLKPRVLRVIVLGAVLGLNLWGLVDYFTSYKKESWDQAAGYVAENVVEGDLILIHKNFVKEPFNYYFRKYDKDVPQYPLRGTPAEIGAQIRALPPHRRIWLVASHGPREELYEVLKVLVKVGEFREEKPLVGINVFLFDAS